MKDTRGRTTSLFIMPHCLSTVICLPSIARPRRRPPSREPQTRRPHGMSISSLRSGCLKSQLQSPAQGQETTPYTYPHPRRRFASQYISYLSTASLRRGSRSRSRYSVGLARGTVVVQGRTGLPEMAMPHPWLSVPPASLPLLYPWHSRSRYAGTFPSFSSHH